MQLTPEVSARLPQRVAERDLVIDGVPVVLWTPDIAPDSGSEAGPGAEPGAHSDTVPTRPLILVCHGGGQHKRAPGVVARATHYATRYGFAAAAFDLPGHGDRPRSAADEQWTLTLRKKMADGDPVAALVEQYNAELAERAVPELRAVLEALLSDEALRPGGAPGPSGSGPADDVPVGFWGLSLGGAVGIPFVAAEPRVAAAVLGLVGTEGLADAATRLTVPVEFLVQWDDELVPRADALAVFDALGSREKSLHANPGRHVEVPRFEVDSSGRFFGRHLGARR
jgi:pimeloyl-ACP methyl ester carboxylesterase